MKPVISFFLLLFLLIFNSCKDLQEVTVTNVDSFTLSKISAKELEGELQLKIKNPNPAGFSIYPSEFDISYGSLKLGKAKLHKRVHIGANTEKSYIFKLKTNPENLNLFDIFKLVGSEGSGTIEINGYLKVGKLLVRKKYPVNYKDKVNLLK